MWAVRFAFPVVVLLIIFLSASSFLPLGNATQSYPNKLSVILYTSGPTEYNEAQNVELLGQVTQAYGSTMSGENIVAVPNAPYEIVDADTGNVIASGYADQNGEFQYEWTAERIDGKSNVNLVAESYGWASKPLSLEIYQLENQTPASNPSYTSSNPSHTPSASSTNPSGISQWQTSTSYPDPYAYNCVTNSGYIYCVGGGNGISYDESYYAPLSSSGIGQWSATTNYPTNTLGQNCVTYYNDIYCVGGLISNDGEIANNVYYAPLSSSGIGQWSATTNFPINIEKTSCVVQSGYMYCVGGEPDIPGIGASNNVYYAPLSSSGIGQWSATTNFPAAVLEQSCVTDSGYIYCVGAGITNEVYYAPLSSTGIGQWSATTNYPINHMEPSCYADSNYVYCVGGFAGNSLTNEVYYAPLSSTGIGQWSATTNYPVNIVKPSCVTYSTYIYCVGGASGPANSGNGINNAYFASILAPSNPPVNSVANTGAATNLSENGQPRGSITISNVTPITTDTHTLIYIEGSGFGDAYPQTTQLPDGSVLTKGCNTNTPSIAILDNGSGNDKWPAGWYCDQVYPGGIGLYIAKWSNTEIVLNGFGSTLGTNNQKLWNINSGDPITIAIFGPNQQGKAIYQLATGSQSSEENNSTQVQGAVTSPATSYQVTFTESGLQQSCWFWIFGCSLPSWSVTFDGNTQTSASTSITFNNVNQGTYSYSASVSGYSVSSTVNPLQINGNINQVVVFIKSQ